MMTPVPDMPGSQPVFRRDRQVRLPLLRSGVTGVVFAGVAAAAAATKLGPLMLVIAGVIGLAALGLIHVVRVAGDVPDRTYTAWHRASRLRASFHPVGRSCRIPSAARPGGSPRRRCRPVRAPPDRPSDRIQVFRASARGPEPVLPAGAHESRSPTVTVQLVRTSGRRLVLPAPVVSGPVGDSQFSDEVSQLEQWRQRYGPPAVAPAR
jgi:hypothetical protein